MTQTVKETGCDGIPFPSIKRSANEVMPVSTTDFSFSDHTPQAFRTAGSDNQHNRPLVDMCDRNSLSSTFQRERQRGDRDNEESFFSKPIDFSDPYQKAHFVKQLEHLDRTVHNLLNKYRGDDHERDRTIYPPGHPKHVEDDYHNHKGHDHHKHKVGGHHNHKGDGDHDWDRPHKKPDFNHPQCHLPDKDKPKPEPQLLNSPPFPNRNNLTQHQNSRPFLNRNNQRLPLINLIPLRKDLPSSTNRMKHQTLKTLSPRQN